jgi:diketogulonate reductase-like aldo/keto reductase
MRRLFALPGGLACVTNQVYYSLRERGVEFDLLPWQRQHRIPLMAYCPIDQGAMARDERVGALARPLGLNAAQLALAWLLRDGGVVAVPKAVRETHLRDNLAAAGVTLDTATRHSLDALYPPPRAASPLAIV